MALKESSISCNGITRSHSTSSAMSLRKNPRSFVNHEEESITPTTPPFTNVSQYFVHNKEGHVSLLTLLAESKYHEVKKLLNIEGASDVKMFKRLILSVGNSEFRNSHRVEKTVADEIFMHAINELTYRSENITQLDKYYRSSYPAESTSPKTSGCGANGSLKETEVNGQTTSLSQYFTRDVNLRIPLWVMMVEEQYEDIRGVLLAPPTLNEVQTLRLVAANMADKDFRETHRISKEVADEVFECAADELMAREGTMTQLLDHYNKSYN